jgi:hypothetical protein
MRIPIIALSALALTGCAVAAPPARQADSGPGVERPTYNLGDRWIRSDGIFEVIRVDSDGYLFSKSPRDQILLTRDLVIASHRFQGGMFEFTPPPRIPWPLQVGAKGSTAGILRTPYGQVASVTVDWEVAAFEPVEVPAGKFQAFRVVFRHGVIESSNFGRGFQSPGLRHTLTLYYAPEPRQIVRAESTMWPLQFQVVALDPQETAPLTIDVRDPVDQATVPGAEDLRLDVAVSGGRGVSQVAASLNGERVASEDAKGPPRRTILLETPLKLRPGKNVLLVTATDAAGTSSQAARTLYYEPRVELQLPPAGQSLRVGARHIELSGVVSHPSIHWLSVSLNGVEKLTKYTQVEAPEHAFSASLELQDGRNVVGVRTYKTDFRGVSDERVEERVVFLDRSLPRETVVAVVGDPATPAAAATLPATPAPLLVALSSPADQATVSQETLGLAGVVSGGKGVRRVLVALNGVEVSRREEREPQRTLDLRVPIKLREGQNTVVVTAVEADGTISQEVRTVRYDRLVPLTVAFRYPQNGSRVAEAASVAAAVITSSRGVTSVRVTLNGREVHTQTERAPQRSLLVTAPLVLREGANVIGLIATDADGSVRQEERTVTLERPAVAAIAPAAPPALPASESWAVVIGVSDYESRTIPRLRFSVSDAEAIYATLIGPGGFKPENVLLLTDTTERKPTLRNIKWALGTFLARSAKKDDTVLMFFAGHGAPEADPRGIERDGLAKYLVPSDADPDDLYASAFPMEELQTIFARIEAERIIAFLDTCYSGAAGGRTFTARATRAGSVDEVFLERLARAKGRAVVTASRPSEVSIELPELGHGIFTYYLLEGLRGAADVNRDSIVTLQELYDYLEAKVTQKSRSVGGNQHPVMKGELEGVLPIVRVKP